ncbi:MAG: division/cell wall cluster transcriptional repressor MraZ [Candidatus Latescibacterota bacterium]
MAQFLGEYEVPVDDKGRIFVPAEFRRKFPPEADDTLVVVRGFDRCLNAYPQNVWEETSRKMLRLPQTERKARMLVRGILSQAAEARLDRQGRANIPRRLLERVGIRDRIVVVGALERMELWEPEEWKRHMEEVDTSLVEVAENYNL